MTELAKSDIFFFITAIAVIVIGIFMAALLIYGFVIARKVNKIVDKVKEEGEGIIEDIHDVRAKLKTGAIVAGLVRLFKVNKTRNKKNGKKED